MSRELPIQVRSCGTCSLCCTVMGVQELHKEKNIRCEHLTVLGRCSIYEDRPGSCRVFKCLWLQGMMPYNLKPSTIRAVGTATNEGTSIVLHIAPADKGTWRHGILRDWIRDVNTRGVPVVIVCGEERFLFGGIPDVDAYVNEVSVDQEKATLYKLKRDDPKTDP